MKQIILSNYVVVPYLKGTKPRREAHCRKGANNPQGEAWRNGCISQASGGESVDRGLKLCVAP